MVKTDKEVNKAVEKKISNYRKKLSNKEMSEIINTTLSNGVFVADKYALCSAHGCLQLYFMPCRESSALQQS